MTFTSSYVFKIMYFLKGLWTNIQSEDLPNAAVLWNSFELYGGAAVLITGRRLYGEKKSKIFWRDLC